ncbi:hypothetical protein Celaphus_00017476, partial [Cervus elaphus hippelaphus]
SKEEWPQQPSLDEKRKKRNQRTLRPTQRREGRWKPCSKEVMRMDEVTKEEEDEETQEVKRFFFSSSEDRCQILNATSHKVFVALASFEPVLHEFHVTQAGNLYEAKYIPELAYHGLYLLCSPLHREGNKILRCIFHQILYIILMRQVGKGCHHSPLAIMPPVVSSRNLVIQLSSGTSPLDSILAFLDNTPAVSGVESHQRVLRKIQQKRIS